MGLEEKRWRASYDNDYTPAFQARMEELSGSKIAVEIDWPSFQKLDDIRYLDTSGFQKVRDALESICSDQIGRDAIAEGLKCVKFGCVPDPSQKKCVFEGGVLQIVSTYEDSSGNVDACDVTKILSDGL